MTIVRPGQKLSIPAGIWNDLQSMLRWWKGSRLERLADELEATFPPSLIWVKNISSSDVKRGEVLGIGDPVISLSDNADFFKDRLQYEGTTPSTTTPHYGRYAVLREPAVAGTGFARAIVSGVALVKLSITDADDLYCEIENNVATYLKTAALGSSRILWKSTGTGSTDKWGLIRVGDGLTHCLGKADASIANSASGTVRVYSGTAGSESDTGQTIASCYNRGRYIYDEEFVRVFLENGKPYVLPASGSTLLLGKTDASHAKDATGTVSVWSDAWGSDTTDNITATNSILSITAASKKVFVQWMNGTYYIVQCECPV